MRRMTLLPAVVALAIASLTAAQRTSDSIARALPVFTDVTAASGIRFRHHSGAFGKKYLPETMGAGVAFFDADGDGWQDILLVNSKSWPGRASGGSSHALYRNVQGQSFVNITPGTGLGVPMYGMGAAAAALDNDGHED